jgi:hypothetical protein
MPVIAVADTGVRDDSISFARPKSRILIRPSLVTKRFSGFRSR